MHYGERTGTPLKAMMVLNGRSLVNGGVTLNGITVELQQF